MAYNECCSGAVAPISPNQVEPLPAALAEIGDDEYMDREIAQLYLWNNENNAFMELDGILKSGVEARVVQTGQFQCETQPSFCSSRSQRLQIG